MSKHSWIADKDGVLVYETEKPGRISKYGFKVFLDTASYTGEERVVVHGFYINKNGEMKRRSYNTKMTTKDGKDYYRKNYYIVSIPKEIAVDVALAIAEVMDSAVSTAPEVTSKEKEIDRMIKEGLV